MARKESKAVRLPERDEMLRRLLQVSQEDHLQERFYPILLGSAGRRLVAGGVVMMFALAIYDYAKEMPPIVASLVHQYVPQFIEAIVDDEDVAEEAKGIHQDALKSH